MGQFRLGSLPHPKRRSAVVDRLECDSDFAARADVAAHASEADLKRSTSDPGFRSVSALRVQLPLWARTPRCDSALRDIVERQMPGRWRRRLTGKLQPFVQSAANGCSEPDAEVLLLWKITPFVERQGLSERHTFTGRHGSPEREDARATFTGSQSFGSSRRSGATLRFATKSALGLSFSSRRLRASGSERP